MGVYARHPECSKKNHLSTSSETKLSNTTRGRDTNVFLPLIVPDREDLDEGSEMATTTTTTITTTTAPCTEKYITGKKRLSAAASGDLSQDEVEDEEEEEEKNIVRRCTEEGALDSMDSLRVFLPMKRGLSRYFNGKSQSFSSLTKVDSVKDLAKPDGITLHRAKRLKHISTDWQL